MKSLTPKHELEILRTDKYTRVIGIDEVGRGCWAGPVAVGAYIFEIDSPVFRSVNDSKQLTRTQREKTYSKLSDQKYSVLLGDLEEINSVGIGKTIEHLIDKIFENFSNSETFFLIDGQFSKNFGANSKKIIKGDANFYSIAAASILAKVERDKLMRELDLEYPNYGFAVHKGYATLKHREALAKYGICDLHRTSYKPIKILMNNF